jgi:hypothetical protein
VRAQSSHGEPRNVWDLKETPKLHITDSIILP